MLLAVYPHPAQCPCPKSTWVGAQGSYQGQLTLHTAKTQPSLCSVGLNRSFRQKVRVHRGLRQPSAATSFHELLVSALGAA